jgi:hypothetical protein
MSASRFYQPNAPGYGSPTIADIANPVSAYTALPSDVAVLVNLTGYSGAGPTITWTAAPREDFPVCIRSVAGSGASHNWSVAAPTGLTIEDPENPGTFGASVTMAAAFEGAIWNYDRANQRLFLESILVPATAAAPAQTVTTNRRATPLVLAVGVQSIVAVTGVVIAAGQKAVIHATVGYQATGEGGAGDVVQQVIYEGTTANQLESDQISVIGTDVSASEGGFATCHMHSEYTTAGTHTFGIGALEGAGGFVTVLAATARITVEVLNAS